MIFWLNGYKLQLMDKCVGLQVISMILLFLLEYQFAFFDN